jgi:hypothetical protein
MVKQGIGGKQMTTLEKLMRVLADGGWHSTAELVKEVGHRFSATVHVAKQRGHQIEKRRVDKNQFEYRLLVASIAFKK